MAFSMMRKILILRMNLSNLFRPKGPRRPNLIHNQDQSQAPRLRGAQPTTQRKRRHFSFSLKTMREIFQGRTNVKCVSEDLWMKKSIGCMSIGISWAKRIIAKHLLVIHAKSLNVEPREVSRNIEKKTAPFKNATIHGASTLTSVQFVNQGKGSKQLKSCWPTISLYTKTWLLLMSESQWYIAQLVGFS